MYRHEGTVFQLHCWRLFSLSDHVTVDCYFRAMWFPDFNYNFGECNIIMNHSKNGKNYTNDRGCNTSYFPMRGATHKLTSPHSSFFFSLPSLFLCHSVFFSFLFVTHREPKASLKNTNAALMSSYLCTNMMLDALSEIQYDNIGWAKASVLMWNPESRWAGQNEPCVFLPASSFASLPQHCNAESNKSALSECRSAGRAGAARRKPC